LTSAAARNVADELLLLPMLAGASEHTIAIQAEGASDAASDRLLPSLLLLLLLQVHTHGKQSGCDASEVECAADGVQQHHLLHAGAGSTAM
jgi:hypothetical protein